VMTPFECQAFSASISGVTQARPEYHLLVKISFRI
jgi:hypothetical protein